MRVSPKYVWRASEHVSHLPHGISPKKKKADGCYESIELRADEHIYGLGEKFGRLDKVGLNSVAWQSDTTHTVSERAYKNIPFFMSNYGYGIFIHTSKRIDYEIGSESYVATNFRVSSDDLQYYFIYGPDFKQILSGYSSLTGRAPMPPRWSFGLWMSRFSYKNRPELESICQELRDKNVPCDVVHIDPDWMRPGTFCDLVWNEKAWPERREMLTKLHEMGFHISLWEQPYVRPHTDMFKEGKKKGYFATDKKGDVYIQSDFEDHPTAFIDYSNPEAVKWIQQKHLQLLKDGADVFKTDMSESVAEDAIFANGMTGAEMHNLYPLLYNKTVFEAVDQHSKGKGIVWGRSAWAGSQRYPLGWAGDCHSTYEDMACTLRSGLSYGLSGVPFWSHDIGGFQGPPPPADLYIRWAQFGLLCSHSRCHGVGPHEPWHFGDEALRIFQKYDNLRYRLLPYLWSTGYEATLTGLPGDSADCARIPGRSACRATRSAISARTVAVGGTGFQSIRQCHGVSARKANGSITGRKKSFEGPVALKRTVDLETMPIYLRENSIIPFGPAMKYVDEKPYDEYAIDIFVSQRAEFTLWNENAARMTVEKTDGGMRLQSEAIEGKLAFTIYDIDLPATVEKSGVSIEAVGNLKDFDASQAAWHYNAKKRILSVKFENAAAPFEIKIQ